MSLHKLRGDDRKARHKFRDVPEQATLKAGLTRLYQEMALPQSQDELNELPRRANGTSKLLRPGFFLRLLSGQCELKGSVGNDVSAAQADLGHLSLEQLLVIRSGTLDFLTNSTTHSAHQAFVRCMDNFIFEKFSGQMLTQAHSGAVSAFALRELGFSIVVILGVLECAAPCGEMQTLPVHWAVRLSGNEWPDRRLAIFDSAKLSLRILCGEFMDVAAASNSDPIALVMRDLSTGQGVHRKLSWDIIVVDPCSEDILSIMETLPGLRDQGRQARRTVTTNLCPGRVSPAKRWSYQSMGDQVAAACKPPEEDLQSKSISDASTESAMNESRLSTGDSQSDDPTAPVDESQSDPTALVVEEESLAVAKVSCAHELQPTFCTHDLESTSPSDASTASAADVIRHDGSSRFVKLNDAQTESVLNAVCIESVETDVSQGSMMMADASSQPVTGEAGYPVPWLRSSPLGILAASASRSKHSISSRVRSARSIGSSRRGGAFIPRCDIGNDSS